MCKDWFKPKVKQMIQSQDYVAVLNFFQTVDKKAKEVIGIYYFSKTDYNVHYIKGDYGKILFDQTSQNIIATDGHQIH